jgi:hypothetical protein
VVISEDGEGHAGNDEEADKEPPSSYIGWGSLKFRNVRRYLCHLHRFEHVETALVFIHHTSPKSRYHATIILKNSIPDIYACI